MFILYTIAACAVLLAVIMVCSLLTNSKSAAPTTNADLSAYADEYQKCGCVLVFCVGEIYSTLGLNRPGKYPVHIPATNEGQAVTVLDNGCVVFSFVFDRSIDISRGGVMADLASGTIQHSTITAQEIGQKLSGRFTNCCIVAGIGSYVVYNVCDVANHRVRIDVVRGY